MNKSEKGVPNIKHCEISFNIRKDRQNAFKQNEECLLLIAYET